MRSWFCCLNWSGLFSFCAKTSPSTRAIEYQISPDYKQMDNQIVFVLSPICWDTNYYAKSYISFALLDLWFADQCNVRRTIAGDKKFSRNSTWWNFCSQTVSRDRLLRAAKSIEWSFSTQSTVYASQKSIWETCTHSSNIWDNLYKESVLWDQWIYKLQSDGSWYYDA